MADIKLSSVSQETTITGGFLYIILPDGGSPTGYTSYRISTANFNATLQALISANTSDIATNAADIAALEAINSRTQYTSKVSDFQHSQGAGTNIYKISAIATTGTGNMKIGTTLTGSEIMATETIQSSEPFFLEENLYSAGARTLYFTITGSLNVTVYYTSGI